MIALTLIAVGVAMMATAALWSAKIKETQRESRRQSWRARDEYEARNPPFPRISFWERPTGAPNAEWRPLGRSATLQQPRLSDDDFAQLLRDANHDDLDWRE